MGQIQFNEEKKLEAKKECLVAEPKIEGKKFFCRYCGEENKPDAIYCEACGKKIS